MGAPLEDAAAHARRSRWASPRPTIAASAAGWIGSAGCPTTSAGTVIARRSFEEGATRPKKSPCTTAAIGSARWLQVSRPMPTQNGTIPRGIGRVTQRSAETVNGRKRAVKSNGPNAISPASSALLRTGISSSRPLTRSGASDRHLEGDVGAQAGAADDGLLGAEVVEQRHDLLGEGRHRVDERVGRPVRAPVAEQVEGHHVQAGCRRARGPAAGASGAASAARAAAPPSGRPSRTRCTRDGRDRCRGC